MHGPLNLPYGQVCPFLRIFNLIHSKASFYTLPDLQRPLRPVWVTPASTIYPRLVVHSLSFYPIVCLSASRQVADGLERRAGFTYIQGSGDDEEFWSMVRPHLGYDSGSQPLFQGLTPAVFWKNRYELLGTTRSGLPDLVHSLLSSPGAPCVDVASDCKPTPIAHVSGLLCLCSTNVLRSGLSFFSKSQLAVVWLTSSDPSALIGAIEPSLLLHIQIPAGKKGQHHFLHTALPISMPFIKLHLNRGRKACIVCDSGTDISVGACIAALAIFFREDGLFDSHRRMLCRCQLTLGYTSVLMVVARSVYNEFSESRS